LAYFLNFANDLASRGPEALAGLVTAILQQLQAGNSLPVAERAQHAARAPIDPYRLFLPV
jgi:hypothetical protein